MTVENAVAGRADLDPPTPFERASNDPGYLDRLRAAYRGHDDLLDALWWLDHPAQAGPSGAASPLTRLAAARRDLYGPVPVPGAVERVSEAAGAADGARAAALAAVEQAGRDAAGRPPLARAGEVVPDLAGGAEPSQPTAAAPMLQRGVALGVVAPLVAAAAMVGIVAGLGIAGPAHPAASPRLTRPIGQHFEQTVARGDALEVFDVGQRSFDLPGGVAGSLDPASFRRLVGFGDARVLAARTAAPAPSAVCLLLVDSASHVSGSCSSVAAFRSSGLTLERPEDRLPGNIRRVRWYPDGRVVWWSPPE